MADFMKAVHWLKQGKKVRLSIWMRNRYIYAPGGKIKDSNDEPYVFSINQFENMNWQIYEAGEEIKEKDEVTELRGEVHQIKLLLESIKKGH